MKFGFCCHNKNQFELESRTKYNEFDGNSSLEMSDERRVKGSFLKTATNCMKLF